MTRAPRRGFTLLELLVAIALMAIVGGALYSSLYVGMKAHATATRALEPTRRAALAMELLRQDFDAALPPTGVLAGVFAGTSGGGTGVPDSLEFYSAAHVPTELETACDIRRIDLSVETILNDPQPVLMRRITTNLLPAGEPLVHEQVLCRNVKTFLLRYYDGTIWQDSWDSSAEGDILPMAVEVTLEFSRGRDSDGTERTYQIARIFRLHCGQSIEDDESSLLENHHPDELALDGMTTPAFAAGVATIAAARRRGRTRKSAARRARGSVLIIAIGIMIVLTGLTLVFAREMRVEALASSNLLASVQADALVNGAVQHVLNRIANNTDPTTLDTDIQSEAVPLGDGQFWIVRPYPDDETRYAFGIADESAKLNINSATVDMLLALPGMTQDLAASIIDWRDADETTSDSGGAESDYYLLQPEPYYCKNAPFETLDELLLVHGSERDVLYGVDSNRNGVVDENEAANNTQLAGLNGQARCGVCKYLTIYSKQANNSADGKPRLFIGENTTETLRALSQLLSRKLPQQKVAAITLRLRQGPPVLNIFDFYFRCKGDLSLQDFRGIADQITTSRAKVQVGLINVNTAPREVLRCLPGLEDADVDALITKRTANGADLNDITWVAETLAEKKAIAIGNWITARSYQYSADIVGVTNNGRAFKRMKFVFDLRSTPARTVYSRDLTYLGWPLSADVRESLRTGAAVSSRNSFTLGNR